MQIKQGKNRTRIELILYKGNRLTFPIPTRPQFRSDPAVNLWEGYSQRPLWGIPFLVSLPFRCSTLHFGSVGQDL